jgi:hypothetical protein
MFIAKSMTHRSFRFFDLRCEILTFIFVVPFAMASPLIVPKNFKHNFFSLILLLWILLLLQCFSQNVESIVLVVDQTQVEANLANNMKRKKCMG